MKTDDKSNEITALPELIDALELKGATVIAETRYFVSSLPPDSMRLAQVIGSHWEIVNRLHGCLDVTFGEDACRVRKDYAPENLNIVRKIAMNLLRLSPAKKTLPKKRLRACLDSHTLRKCREWRHELIRYGGLNRWKFMRFGAITLEALPIARSIF